MMTERYEVIKNISHSLIDLLDLHELEVYLPWFDYGENIMYKMAGYNGSLESILKRIEKKDPLNYTVVRAPLILKLAINFFTRDRKLFEFDLERKKQSVDYEKVKGIRHIFLATMDNYLNAFFPLLEKFKEKEVLLIIPSEAKRWISFCKLKEQYAFDNIIYIEDIIEMDNFRKEFKKVRNHIEKKYIPDKMR